MNLGEVSLDYQTLIKLKDELVGSLVAGTERRLKSTGVEIVKGRATLAGPKIVEVFKDDGDFETLRTQNIIMATGSRPQEIDVPTDSSEGLIMAEEAIGLKKLPKSIAVVGCDYIGVQLGCIFSHLGTKVTIVESRTRLLPDEDEEIATILQELLTAYGIKIITEARPVNITATSEDEKRLTVADKSGTTEVRAEQVVISRGRKPNTEGLGLEKAGVMMEDTGAIIVDEHLRTNVSNIYAVGDSVGKHMLAQVAMAEGNVAAENAMGRSSTIDHKVIPRCIFTLPEAATVGLIERQAIERGYKVKVSRVPVELNGFAHIVGQTEGLIKIVSDARYGEVLGVQIIGPQAADLIHEAALGIRLEATVEDMAKAIRIHPSLGEAVRDAAWRLYSPLL